MDNMNTEHNHTTDTSTSTDTTTGTINTTITTTTASGIQPLLTVADFNGDGTVNNTDLEDLSDRIINSNYHPLYDLNTDSVLSGADLDLALAMVGSEVPLLDQQIAQATQATMKYYGEGGLERAFADGYGFFTHEWNGHGIHLFNPIITSLFGNSTELVIDQPVGLNFDAEGNLQAVFYIRLPKLLSGAEQNPLNANFLLNQEYQINNQITIDPNDDFPPNSFDTLTEDDWHTHENVVISGLGSQDYNLLYFEESLPSEDFNARIANKIENGELFFPLSDYIQSPKFWMLHGWFHTLNTEGVFGNLNPDLGINAVDELGFHGHIGHSDDHDSSDSNTETELITGSDDDNTIDGTTNSDMINGFNGNDQISGKESSDYIWGGFGDDAINGDNGDDELYGGPDNDILRGNIGHDRLFGGTGDDQLFGDTGNDLLRGGIGNDILTGGDRIDYFVLAPGEGTDTITDFVVNVDKLMLVNGLVAEALSISQSGENALIEFNGETLAILNNVNSADIDPSLTFAYKQRAHHHDDESMSLFRFQNSVDTSKYIYVGQEEAETIESDYPEFSNNGVAFDVFSPNINPEENDTLMAMYRMRNTVSGQYIYVNDGEKQAIMDNESLSFDLEGLAFYAYGTTSEHGQDIYRFRYLETGGYLFVNTGERNAINSNPDYTSVIKEEGLAFRSI